MSRPFRTDFFYPYRPLGKEQNMSVDVSTYCGPYVECKVQKLRLTYEERQCPNAACTRYKQENRVNKLCPECGTAIQAVTLEVEVHAVDPWELEEEFESRLFQPFGEYESNLSDQGLHIWLGGRSSDDDGPSVGSFALFEYEESLTEVRPADIQAELKRFQTDYRDELKLLRERYGASKVKVKWGVLHTIT
jgi:hypothetical protein